MNLQKKGGISVNGGYPSPAPRGSVFIPALQRKGERGMIRGCSKFSEEKAKGTT